METTNKRTDIHNVTIRNLEIDEQTTREMRNVAGAYRARRYKKLGHGK